MTGFLAAATVLVVVTLIILLAPLLRRPTDATDASRTALNAEIYRDQFAELDADFAAGSLSRADFEEGRRELQRRLLEDAGAEAKSAVTGRRAGRSALLVGIALPVAAALLYFSLGNLPALSPESAQPPKVTAQQIEEMVAKLAARMEANPDDPNGWIMLGRSYKAMGRYEESSRAFSKAETLVNEDPHLLAEYAEALALSTGGSLKGRPGALIDRALQLDPDHPGALILAGTAAYERNDFAAAATYWERLLKQLPADSEDAQVLSESIGKARAAAKKGGKPGRSSRGQ